MDEKVCFKIQIKFFHHEIESEGKFSKKYLHSFLRNEDMNKKINIDTNMAETALRTTTLAIFDVS